MRRRLMSITVAIGAASLILTGCLSSDSETATEETVTQSWLGPVAVKSRFTRSLVVRTAIKLRLAVRRLGRPWSCNCCITPATSL